MQAQLSVIQRLDKEMLSKDKAKLEWLWERISAQDYAFDDYLRGKPEFFLSMLAAPTTEAFWLGEDGLLIVSDIYHNVSAHVHLLMWDDSTPMQYFKEGEKLLRDLFETLGVNRFSAYIPTCTKASIRRLVTLLGFRFEGSLREAFLWKGQFYGLEIFGLLKEQQKERRVV